MGIKINQYNSANQKHGYWETNGVKSNFYNGVAVGFEKSYDELLWKCHYNIKGKAIGCEMFEHEQLFYRSGKIFGEEIVWK